MWDGEEKDEEEEGWGRDGDGEGRKGRDGWRVVGFIVVWIFSFFFSRSLFGLGSFRLVSDEGTESCADFCQETVRNW